MFRLEENIPNLGTQILALWRRTVAVDWHQKYGVLPCGFETFVVENERRKGAMYKADNWTYVGETAGNIKFHLHGIDKTFERRSVQKKLVFCKWIKGAYLPTEYEATWNLNGQCKGQMTIFDLAKECTGI